MKPSSASTKSEGLLVTGFSLQCLHLLLERPSGPLRPAIEAALAGHGRPLRWAITAASAQQLSIEAVVEAGLAGLGADPQKDGDAPDNFQEDNFQEDKFLEDKYPEDKFPGDSALALLPGATP
jgi:hypothetical protein